VFVGDVCLVCWCGCVFVGVCCMLTCVCWCVWYVDVCVGACVCLLTCVCGVYVDVGVCRCVLYVDVCVLCSGGSVQTER